MKRDKELSHMDYDFYIYIYVAETSISIFYFVWVSCLWGAYNDRDCVKDLLIKCFFFLNQLFISHFQNMEIIVKFQSLSYFDGQSLKLLFFSRHIFFIIVLGLTVRPLFFGTITMECKFLSAYCLDLISYVNEVSSLCKLFSY